MKGLAAIGLTLLFAVDAKPVKTFDYEVFNGVAKCPNDGRVEAPCLVVYRGPADPFCVLACPKCDVLLKGKIKL